MEIKTYMKNSISKVLSKTQSKHIDAFRWLVSDKKLEGRSYLLAICFIEKALQNLGQSIEIWDHCQYERNSNMISIIKNIISEYPDIEDYCTFAQDWFRINKDIEKVNK